MKILTTILARKDSRGLPGKSHRQIHGSSLFKWTLEQVSDWADIVYNSTNELADVIVSSDDFTILELGRLKYNFSPIERPPELCQDDTPKLDAIRWTVEQVEKDGVKYDAVMDLDVTNPLRRPDDIPRAVQIFLESRPETLVSVVPARRMAFFNQVMVNPFGTVQTVAHTPGKTYTRRQDCPPIYDLNSCIYIYDRKWLDEGSVSPLANKTKLYIMEPWQWCDVDSESDLVCCEALMRRYLWDTQRHSPEN